MQPEAPQQFFMIYQAYEDLAITASPLLDSPFFCGNFKVFFVFLTRHTAPEPVFIHLKEMVAVSNILDMTIAQRITLRIWLGRLHQNPKSLQVYHDAKTQCAWSSTFLILSSIRYHYFSQCLFLLVNILVVVNSYV